MTSQMSGAKVAHSAYALAALRIVAALLFLAHGLTKLVHRFPDIDPILAMREDSVFRHGM